jgi:hypothetical protein
MRGPSAWAPVGGTRATAAGWMSWESSIEYERLIGQEVRRAWQLFAARR